MADVIDMPRVAGSKGFMKGGGDSSGTHEDPNTLRSNVRARIVDLIGEGPFEGWVSDNPLKDVFFDRTPVMNADGSLNFQGVTIDYRLGLPDQPELKGNAVTGETAAPYAINTRVYQAQGPVVRTIADKDATAVKVVVTIPSLNRTDRGEKSAGLYKTSVNYAFDVKTASGAWVEAINVTIDDKCTSPYQRAHRLDLPAGGYPWQIRMRRITADSTSDDLQNQTVFDSYIELVEARLTYMHSCVVSIEVDAKQFGQSVPNRSYRMKARRWQVPSNYNPITRAYSGLWDGTFKEAWTNNPAWIFYGLVTQDRFGLGEFVDKNKIDVAGLYQIAQYCDQMLGDGYGKTAPRYTFNGALTTFKEAHAALQSIAATFRGMSFWSLGQVFATADMPKDPRILVTKANTMGGFEYSSTAIKARHTAASVTWNDPDDFYRPAVDLYRDPDGVRRFGWRQADLQLEGCTNRAQAYRMAAWAVDTELNEFETVTYRASFDHTALDQSNVVTGLLPGDIIQVADPRKMRVRAGGRVVSASSTTRVTIDAPFPRTAGQTYKLRVTRPNGKIAESTITAIDANNVVSLSSALPEVPLAEAVWVITGSDAAPRQYRVLEVAEESKNVFRVTGLFFDPLKFARVEQGIKLPAIPYTRPKTTIAAPTNLAVRESQYFRDNVPRSRVTLSWTPGNDFMSSAYLVTAQTPSGFVSYGEVGAPVIDIDDVQPGSYSFTVTARSNQPGVFAPPVDLDYIVKGWAGATSAPTITGLQIKGGGAVFTGGGATLVWGTSWPAGAQIYEVEYLVRIFDSSTNALVRTATVRNETFTYTYEMNGNDARAAGLAGPRRAFRAQVSALDLLGREGASVSLTVSNPAPAAPSFKLTNLALGFQVETTPPTDPDLAGVILFMSKTSPVALTAANARDMGYAFASQFPGEPGDTWYVRVACYDAFAKDLASLNVAAQQSVTIASQAFDPSAPTIPGTPAIGTNAIDISATNGTISAYIVASWTASTGNFADLYEVQVRQGTGGWVGYFVTGASFELHGLLPATAYGIRVRAVSANRFANSGWSPERTFTTAKNTAAPVNPTGVSVTTSFESAIVTWTDSVTTDLDYIEVWGYAGSSAAAAPTGLTPASVLLGRAARGQTSYVDKLGTANTETYWVRAVNTSGVVATSYVRAGTATAPQLVANQITNGILDDTKFVSDLSGVKVLGALPNPATWTGSKLVLLTTDGKLYRLVGGAWTKAVQAIDVSGQLTKEQIKELDATQIIGEIVADQIKAGAIAFDKLATGLQPPQVVAGLPTASTWAGSQVVLNTNDGKLYRLVTVGGVKQWTSKLPTDDLTGQISATQLADGAVTLAKFEAGYKPVYEAAGLPAVSGYTGPKVILNTTDGKIYRLVSGAWSTATAVVDLAGQVTSDQIADLTAAKITGQVSASQIANEAISASKFASGVRPIESFATLPTAGNFDGRMVYLTTDKKLYRHNGTAFVTGVASSDISGTLAANQIAALEASKITGQMSDAQIAAVGAAKIAGALTNATIASTAMTGQIADAQIAAGIAASKVAGALANATLVAGNITGTLAANQIATLTAGQITGTLSDAQIAAVSAAKVAGTLSDAQIAGISAAKVSGALVNATLAASGLTGTLSDNQIATGLSAAKISGALSNATIDALKIAGQITGTQITDDAITAPKILAGAITGDRLAANTITAREMILTDTQNLLLNGDFRFGKDADWTYSGTVSASVVNVTALAGSPAQQALLFTAASTGYAQNGSGALPGTACDAGDEFQAEFWVRSDTAISGSTVYIQGVQYPANGGAAGQIALARVPATAANTWVKATIRATASAAGRVVIRFSPSNHGGQVWITGARFMRRNAAQLIVDGGIVANHLTANAVTAGKIDANAITAREILAGTITAAEIKGGTITAAEIATDAITSSKIKAGEIIAGKLATDAVVANNIAANAITASKIKAGEIQTAHMTAGTINAGVLIANSITAGQVAANAITASKLMLSDTTNLLQNYDFAQGLTEDWYFQQAGSATLSNALSGDLPAGCPSQQAAKIVIPAGTASPTQYYANSGQAPSFAGNGAPCVVGEEFYGEAWVYSSVAGTVQMQGVFRNTSNGATASAFTASVTVAANNWTKLTGSFVCNTAGKATLRVIPTLAGSTLWITNARYQRRNAADLIVDGTIVGTKLVANSITAREMVLTDSQNLVLNGDFRYDKDADWLYAGTVSASVVDVSATAGAPSPKALLFTASSTGYMQRGDQNTGVPCDAGDEFWAEFWVRSDTAISGNTVYIQGIQYPSNGSAGGQAGLARVPAAAANTWVKATAKLVTSAAGRMTLRFSPATHGGQVWVTGVRFMRRNGASLIVDGTITANAIATDAITASKIKAGEIIAGKLATDAVVADNIAANAITAAKIKAGEIQTAHMTAGTINASVLVAGSITAGQIDALAITADKIALNTITSGQIKAGTITAAEIATGAILASKIIVSDWANNFGNPVFENGSDDAWSQVDSVTDTTVSTTGIFATAPTRYVGFSNVTTGTRDIVGTTWIPVKPGEVWYFSADIGTGTGTTNAPVQLYIRSADGKRATQSPHSVGAPALPTTSWVTREGTFTVPAGRYFMFAGLRISGTTGSVGNIVYTNFKLRRMASSELIVDGAITADKIDVDAVTASKIAAGSVTTSKLAVVSLNLAYNPDFGQGTKGWVREGDMTLPVGPALWTSAQRAPAGMVPIYISSNDTQANLAGKALYLRSGALTNAGVGKTYTVSPSQTYEFSACISALRCRGRIIINWYNSAGTYISQSGGSSVTVDTVNGGAYKNFPKSTLIATAPSTATGCYIYFAMDTVTGNSPYLFVSCLMFAPTFAEATETSPYSAPGTSIIDGGSIITNSITARAIDAGTITATEIKTNTITGAHLEGTTISARELAAGSVIASKLAISTINVLSTGDLSQGLNGVTYGTSGVAGQTGATLLMQPGAGPDALPALRLNVVGTITAGSYFLMAGALTAAGGQTITRIAITGGQYYEASAYPVANFANCQARMEIVWEKSDGSSSATSFHGGSYVTAATSTAGSFDNRPRCFVLAQAPADATQCYVRVRLVPPANTANPQLYAGAFMLAPGTQGQSEPSPFVAPGVTYIQGNSIVTGSITADQIDVTSVQTGILTAGVIKGTMIGAGEITAKHVFLSDTTNMVTSGDFTSSTYTGTVDGWTQLDPNYTLSSGSSTDQGGRWRLACTASGVHGLSNYITGRAGEVITVTAWVYQTSAARASLQLNALNNSGGAIANIEAAFTDVKGQWVRLEGQITLPTNTARFRVYLNNATRAGGDVALTYWGRVSARLAYGASLVVDGAITTAKLDALAVTADKVAANSILGRHLAISSANRAFNADLTLGSLGWSVVNAAPGGTTAYVEIVGDTVYSPAGMLNLRTRTVATPTATTGYYDILNQVSTNAGALTNYPVRASTAYEISAYLSTHRCRGRLLVQFYNASGTQIGASFGDDIVDKQTQTTTPLKTWDITNRSKVIVTSPSGAVTMSLSVRVDGFTTGTAQAAYCMVSGVMFAAAYGADQTDVSPYANPGVTVIDGGSLLTNSVDARVINATQVFADSAVLNLITTGVLTAGAISSDMLAAGTITADKIGVGLGSGNLLFNSDFQAGPHPTNGGSYGWPLGNAGVAVTTNFVADSPQRGVTRLSINFANSATTGRGDLQYRRMKSDGVTTDYYPVKSGVRYELSVGYDATANITPQIFMQWVDSNGNLGAFPSTSTPLTSAQKGGRTGGVYTKRLGFTAVVPDGVVAVNIILRGFYSTANSGTGSIWFSGVYFGEVKPSVAAVPDSAYVFSPWSPISDTVIDGGFIATDTIVARQIKAGSINSDHISVTQTIKANKITINGADGIITGINSLTADLLNANKIKLSGSTNLSSWISGGDSTSIDGGAIYANSIEANKLKIGARGLTVQGIQFAMGRATTAPFAVNNTLSWTTGSITYTDDDATTKTITNVTAGSKATGGSPCWVFWVKGSTTLFATTLTTERDSYHANANAVLMATTRGSTGIAAMYGGTVIDGTQIVTNSISADQIAAGAINADHIASISSTIVDGAITTLAANKITAGTITAVGDINIGSDRFKLTPSLRRLTIQDDQATPVARVEFGNFGGSVYGAKFRASNGVVIFDTTGTGSVAASAVSGTLATGNIPDLASSKITGSFGTDRITPTTGSLFGTSHLADTAVTSAKLDDGAVTGPKTAIATAGANLLPNSDFERGLSCWGIRFSNAGTPVLGIDTNSRTLVGGHVASATIPASTSVGAYFDFLCRGMAGVAGVPVEAGARYEVGGYFNLAGSASAQMIVVWYGTDGAPLATGGFSLLSIPVPVQSGGRSTLSQYLRRTDFVSAPTGAVTAAVGVRLTVVSGGLQQYVFLTRMFLAKARANQTEFSEWSGYTPQAKINTTNASDYLEDSGIPSTYIASLVASKVDVGAGGLSAISANVGTVTAGTIRSSDSKFLIDLANKRILISD